MRVTCYHGDAMDNGGVAMKHGGGEDSWLVVVNTGYAAGVDVADYDAAGTHIACFQ